jgi:hypothetical protein
MNLKGRKIRHICGTGGEGGERGGGGERERERGACFSSFPPDVYNHKV